MIFHADHLLKDGPAILILEGEKKSMVVTQETGLLNIATMGAGSFKKEWAGKVRQVNLKSPICQLENYPVAVSRYNSDWYIWWVPLPHVGGKPYAYYSLNITIDEKDCSN